MATYIVLPIIALLAITLATIEQVSALGLSALPLAIILGMLYGHLSLREEDEQDQRFSTFCKQKLLRIGIVLFGFGLSFQQIIAVGWQAVAIDFLVIATVFSVGTFVGIKVLKLHRDLAILTAAGSAICGAAAVLATESVLKPKQEHITIAIATVVLFGTVAMFSYPFIYQWVGISDKAFGIYIGSTAHEVAQAVAAGQSINGETMQTAVVVKLIRVMMLAPFILMLSAVLGRLSRRAKNTAGINSLGIANYDADKKSIITIPWFVFGFIATAMINSIVILPEFIKVAFSFASQFSLAMAMAALGAQTQWSTIKAAGPKPLILALLLFIILMFGGFFLNSCFA
ncbi:YeiH family protein [Colwellia ponticola]|uniref:YeiH family putative sulfate export transporter n=1 Tax=Colwellia ponticola TaxID=2304625 RepID=A0A8H2JRL9_9GAMM|nr:YeiH family protein [Colwellia ponticola]TMM47904.1 YeiH family putative sulfate export transporter [Colwellia ponticola]